MGGELASLYGKPDVPFGMAADRYREGAGWGREKGGWGEEERGYVCVCGRGVKRGVRCVCPWEK